MMPDLAPYQGQELIVQSESLARELHAGQFYDKKPVPEFGGIRRTYANGHLAPAARIVEAWGFGAEEQATVWLHDTIEDVEGVTAGTLIRRRMPAAVGRAVLLQTKEDDLDYDDPFNFYPYDAAIAEDRLATVSKTAENLVNLANTTLMFPRKPPEKMIKHMRRYLDTVTFLRDAMPPIPNDESNYLKQVDSYIELGQHLIPHPRRSAA